MKISVTLLAVMAGVLFLSLSLLLVGHRHLPIVHLVLAAGVLPLILGAMIQFTPVLTRTRPAGLWITLLPFGATLTAAAVVTALEQDRRDWVWPLALWMMVLVMLLMGWIAKRAGMALDGAHPGVRWYQSALFCLLSGLAVMVLALLQPQYWSPLRTLHLHLNLIGFIGMTAVGTLQVLLPTVAGYKDDQTARRLCCHLKYVLLGSWLAAVGAAWLRPISWLAVPLWFFPLIALLRPVWPHRYQIMRSDHAGATISLIGAIIGFMLTLLSGIPIMLHWMAAEDSVPLFLMLFVLPLVTGALSYLWPLWLRGVDLQRQQLARVLLSYGGSLRTALWLGSGLLLVAGLRDIALPLTVVVVLVFVMQMLVAWVKS
ncbi:MAG: hypothetical protein HQL58_09255 [Magnetococcales bacterium]|nr:hypothetical protein [Magnetococcales bacterium]